MNYETAYNYFSNYETDEIIQNYIAQANSRYILYNAGEPIKNFPKYTQGLDVKCTHIAFGYLDCGCCFFNANQLDEATICMEKAAGVLEHLYAYKSCIKIFKEYYCLICGLAYYIASQYSKSYIVLKNYSCQTKIATMIYLFLIRKFFELEKLLWNIQGEDTNNTKDEEVESFIYAKILANAFSEMLHYIYNGDYKALEKSKCIINDLIALSKINDEPYLWWTFRLLFLVLEEYESASLWKVLPPVITNNERCVEYIYANLYKNTPIVELFKSQRECININCGNNDGFVVSMPTSSGKTKIAEITLVKTLSEYPDALCIYIAPFRSLANEIENSLSTVLSVMGFKVSNLYGKSQATQLDRQMMKKASVIIATPEKIKSILRSNDDLEERIKLVIIDEGHLVGAQPRYITEELLIEEIKIVLRRNSGKIILLSAVLPNLSDFSEWVSGNPDRMTLSSWRPSAQRFGELNFVNHTVNLKWNGEPASYNKNFVETKLIRPERQTASGKIYKAAYFPNDKKQAVGATAVKMLSMGSVLIYVGRSNMVMSQARIVSKLFLEHKIEHHWNNSADLNYVELTCEEAYGKDSEILKFIKQGIICHSSKLPNDVRQSVERLMSNSSPKVIIATSTLGQGVNIGVSTVIVSNVYLNQDKLVDVKDFWNLAGRAGRAFTDTEGKILYTIDRNNDDYSVRKQIEIMNRYFEHENIEKATSGLYLLLRELFRIAKNCGIEYKTFLELLAENTELADEETAKKFFEESNPLLDLIDDTLISMDIMNNVQDLQDCSSWIDSAFRNSLAYIQAKSYTEFSSEQVMDVLKARNNGVVKLAGPTSTWKEIACSSIPLKASIFIAGHIEEVTEYIDLYCMSSQSFDDLMDLIQCLDSFVALIPISTNKKLIEVVNSIPIRNKWYGGCPIDEINILDDKALDACNQYYGFHFPWIINSIAKKMSLIGKTDEAKILEDISLFSEIGVPDIKSSKIYLSGVRSRECALELSKKIGTDNDWLNPIKGQLLKYWEELNAGRSECSERTYRWLNLLNASDKNSSRISINRMKIRIDYCHAGTYDELIIRSYESRIYVCSYDYKIRILIRKEVQDKYAKLLGIQGLFFKKATNGFWILQSHNPFIQIV